METLFFWFTRRRGATPTTPYPRDMLFKMACAGIWPSTHETLDAWAEETANALGGLDALAAGWYAPFAAMEAKVLDTFAPTAERSVPLRSLEPYYVEPARRWTRHLAGKRVTVVTSFVDSIQHQLTKVSADPTSLWSALESPETILPPTTTWSLVRTGHAPMISQGEGTTAWPAHVKSWHEAVDHVVQEVLSQKPEVALIGCGALGLCIGARLKQAGISAFVLGGAIQVLFGIKGRRWEQHPIISKFWNDAWIWPLASDIPRGAGLVEGGCYWGAPVSKPSSTPR